jgi:hypothetical protein
VQSTAANRHDDFERVAVGENLVRMAAARYDFAIALERDALAREVKTLEQLATVEWTFETVGFAVDG